MGLLSQYIRKAIFGSFHAFWAPGGDSLAMVLGNSVYSEALAIQGTLFQSQT